MGLGVPDAGPILSRLSSSIIRPTMDGTGERPLPQADTTSIITIITTTIITIITTTIITMNTSGETLCRDNCQLIGMPFFHTRSAGENNRN